MIHQQHRLTDSSGEELVTASEFPSQLVVFTLEGLRFGIDLWITERIVPAVEITPLPDLPSIVKGVIKVHDSIIPVVNMRERFNLPQRDLELTDRIIIAQTRERRIALIADHVEGVHNLDNQQTFPASGILQNIKFVKGILYLEDELVMIHDLDEFLSLDEEATLNSVLGE